MKQFFVLLLLSTLIFPAGCQKDNSADNGSNNGNTAYVKGKNRFTITVDGVAREYYVHVPNSYTGNTAVPVVFMLHGTSGNGEEFYDKSGWKEVADTADFIAVFPSSLRFCINDNGEIKNTTKWNTVPDAEWFFCAGQNPKDDIKFLRTVIAELESKFKVDSKRIYLCGFSNGGQMAAKCAISLSDKLAAVVESAGSFFLDTTYIPLRKLPVLFQRGNEDYGPGNTGPALPLSRMNELISVSNSTAWYRTAQAHIRDFALNSSFVISGDTTKISFADYTGTTGNPFKMAMIKGLAHAYPNGTNHPLHAATSDWQWFRQYSLP